jgi:phosphatidylserine/phosphatidylglycerophosphate/cardiolipin synthase-like enzyme
MGQESTLDLNQHVRYIHTKYLLIDPLGDDPVIITGSANFSPDSVSSNDENMLLIRANTAVADVYVDRTRSCRHPVVDCR